MRSIRIHLKKQLLMMRLILSFYKESREALDKGVAIDKVVALPVREQIGRYKYTPESDLDVEFDKIETELAAELAKLVAEKDEY